MQSGQASDDRGEVGHSQIYDHLSAALQRSGRVVGFIEPSLPSLAAQPPTGPNWLQKRDGFRIWRGGTPRARG
jgi:hypothetical protein